MTTIHTSSPDGSLSRKGVAGGVWILSARMLNRGLSFLRAIILAKRFAPADFGIPGIATELDFRKLFVFELSGTLV